MEGYMAAGAVGRANGEWSGLWCRASGDVFIVFVSEL